MNLKFIKFGIIIALLLACDQIEPPYTEDVILAEKTILIEKFTGHQCSNCPEASRVIENELKTKFLNIDDNSKSSIISVAIHPGNVSLTNIDKNYPYDFRTTSSDSISLNVGVVNFIPVGTINRISGGDAGNRCWSKDNWSEQVKSQLVDNSLNPLSKIMNIQINTSIDTTKRIVDINTNINTFIENYENYNLSLFIMEDSIIAPQKDGSNYIENYQHDHIYRCSVNGIYGEQLTLQSNHSIELNTTNNINWSEDWNNINNCYVVAYIYDTKSGVIKEAAKKKFHNE